MPSNMTDSSSKNANAILELSDGSAYQGISFGATDKSVAGECVFQTGKPYTNILYALVPETALQVW